MANRNREVHTHTLEDCKEAAFNGTKNAKRLLDDAQFNASNGRFHSAALLAAYALDETGKAFLMAKLVLAAMDCGDQHLTTTDFEAEGLRFGHLKRLDAALQVSMPFLTGVPPGTLTSGLATDQKETIWRLRNAVAYLDVDGDKFVTPTQQVSPEECQELLDLVSQIMIFVENHVESYWQREFRPMPA